MLPTVKSKRDRSKNGCQMCRTKKVKCEEQRPNCARCYRLKLLCTWPAPQEKPPPSAKKRDPKVVNSRGKPRDILPALSPAMSSAVEKPAALGAPISPALVSSQDQEDDAWMGSDEWWESLELDAEVNWSEQPVGEDNFQSPMLQVDPPGDDFGSYVDMNIPVEPARSPEITAPLISPSRSLSDYHFIVPNALILTPFQHQVLHHYQTVFSTYRSTKDPKWGTHKMLLNYASYDPMIMQFILAVSINDYSIRIADERAYQNAQEHFELASELWIETMKEREQTDQLALMISFFFLYLYMTKRRGATRHHLTNLSRSVVEFVKKHKLDKRCLASTRSPSPRDILEDGLAMTSRQRSLLARLIMWTFDEDVKCGFQGSGGHLAQYLSENDSRTKKIYDASRSVLENHWGVKYPDCQVFDDNENSVILEFLFAMMPLQQDINDLTSKPSVDSAQVCRRIERKFNTLEQEYNSVFRIAATKTMPRTRVLVNADYDVVLFNSLKIYYFRSIIVDLTVDTPPEICTALKTLLSIVQITFAYNGTELHERLQWPLFLAGIETDDFIYREWIISKLTSYRVLSVLRGTLEAQQRNGLRLRMTEIRDILCKDEEDNVLVGTAAFLCTTPVLHGL